MKQYLTKNNFWNILTILKIYGLALFVFFIFRLVLFFTQFDKITNCSLQDIVESFIMGVRFDIVICGYLLLIPYLLLSLNSFLFHAQKLHKFVFFLVYSLFTLSFIVSAADIPYFNQFFARFSITAFEWLDSPVFVFKMILGEPRYWLYVIPFIGLNILFYKVLKRIFTFPETQKTKPAVLPVFISLFFTFLMLVGIRGRLEQKSPIRVGTAFIFDNPFLNQLGLNPNFTFIRSYLDSQNEENRVIHLMDNQEALRNVQGYFNIQNPSSEQPLLRTENKDTIPQFKNVVLILMESMSASKMTRHGNPNRLTPFLDSLSNQGIYFENCYSAGIHTFNGVFSSIFGLPALFRQHPMKGSNIPQYHGLGTALKLHDYSTIYFTTHDGQFDNIEGFLRGNDFDQVISQKNYPSEEVKTALGVTDEYMFKFSIPYLNTLSRQGKPFLSVFLTSSDHGPYYVPDSFKGHSTNAQQKATEFADYSLRKFIQLAQKQTWFKNTLFVFVADHGAAIDADYDVSLAYNHVPLLFYAPNIISKNEIKSQMACQIDITPSIMGYLGIPFNNNTLGINLFKAERPYSYFNVDDKFGVIDKEWLLIVKKEGDVGLYHYQNKDKKNYAKEFPELVNQMQTYSYSNLQTLQYLLKEQKM
jgi:phosphoglycerol transferase MdoB-like AlkP superfamily enzyme